MEADQTINVAREDGILIVRFVQTDLIDAKYLNQAHDELTALAGGASQPKIVLDMGNVDYLGSLALGVLISVAKSVSEQGGSICVAGLNSALTDIFDVARLDQFVPIHDSVTEAVQRLRE